MHDRESITPQARDERLGAYAAGANEGTRIIAGLVEHPHHTDPYLQYQYLLGISQTIANHGRDIAGIRYTNIDPVKKGQKA